MPIYTFFSPMYIDCNHLLTHFYVETLFQTDLPNMTWHEVQTRLLDVQKDQQMCIHKSDLTQLGQYP